MAYHAFVIMPYGTKEQIDFNRVYADLIKPALEAAGFEVFGADEEMRAGDIRADMFQELLLADLVVADLPSITRTSGTNSGCAMRLERAVSSALDAGAITCRSMSLPTGR